MEATKLHSVKNLLPHNPFVLVVADEGHTIEPGQIAEIDLTREQAESAKAEAALEVKEIRKRSSKELEGELKG